MMGEQLVLPGYQGSVARMSLMMCNWTNPAAFFCVPQPLRSSHHIQATAVDVLFFLTPGWESTLNVDVTVS